VTARAAINQDRRLRIAGLIVTTGLIATLALGGIAIVPRGWHGWQIQQAQDDPVELSRLRLAAVATRERLSLEIERAIAVRDLDLAESLLALAAERDIVVAADQRARVDAMRAAAFSRALSDFGHGFVAGDRDTDAAFAGALVGDVSGFGDLRDLALEGRKHVRGEPVDETVLMLAAAGLALSAATWLSLGGGLPARGGLSAVKVASRAKLISPALTANLGRMAAGAIDRPALSASLAAATRFDIVAMRAGAGGIVRPAALARLGALGRDAGAIYARTGQRGLRQVLAVAQDTGDLGKAARLAAARPSTARATLALLGRSALVIGALSLQAIGWMLALLGYALAMAFAAQRFGWWLGRLGRGRRSAKRGVPLPAE